MPSLLALAALAGSIVVGAPVAAAQTAGIDQYLPNPGAGHAQPGDRGDGGGNGDGRGSKGGGSGGGASAGPAGDDQPPGAAGGGEGHRSGERDGQGGGGAPSSPTTAEGGIGDLPFTDYPMTPLLLAVLALLGAGLIARLATLAARRHRRPSAPSSTP